MMNNPIFSTSTKLLLAGVLLLGIVFFTGLHMFNNETKVRQALRERDAVQTLNVKLASLDETKDQLLILYSTAGFDYSPATRTGLLRDIAHAMEGARDIETVDAAAGQDIMANLGKAADVLRKNPVEASALRQSLLYVGSANMRLQKLDSAMDEKIEQISERVIPLIDVDPYKSLWILGACLILIMVLAGIVMTDIILPLRQITAMLVKAGNDPANIAAYTLDTPCNGDAEQARRALNSLFAHIACDMQAVRDANKKAGWLMTAIEATRDGIGMVDADGRLIFANGALLDIHGISEADKGLYIGQCWKNLYSPKGMEIIEQTVLPALHENGHWQGETKILRRDNTVREMEMTLTLLDDGGMIGTARDVTRRKTAECEREELQKLFAQSQKMEAVGRLTGGIAHDFNNLLTIVSGNLELLQDCPSVMDSEAKAYIRVASRAVERGAELTHRLLSFSRKQMLAPRTIDINTFLPQTALLMTRALGESIDLVFDLTDNAAVVSIDPGQLENALLNLAINARDAMPDGGTITIRTENTVLDDRKAKGDFKVIPGSYIKVSLTDTGHGMSAATLAQVFDPFFTTKGLGRGTGLGLSMVYGFVKQTGGYIFIDSEEGKGTTVSMLFRQQETKAQTETEKTFPSDKAAPKTATILIAEDESDVLDLSKTMLTRLGYKVHSAANGPEALRVLESDEPIDLLLTDIMMPGGMNGYDLADRAQELRPGIKILFVSGYASESPMEIEDGGEFRLLFKPYTQAKLSREIRNLLEPSMAGAAE